VGNLWTNQNSFDSKRAIPPQGSVRYFSTLKLRKSSGQGKGVKIDFRYRFRCLL